MPTGDHVMTQFLWDYFVNSYLGTVKKLGKLRISLRFLELKRFIIKIIMGPQLGPILISLIPIYTLRGNYFNIRFHTAVPSAILTCRFSLLFRLFVYTFTHIYLSHAWYVFRPYTLIMSSKYPLKS